jgi:hypothetical protein
MRVQKMQGLTSMKTDSEDVQKAVLEDRKRGALGSPPK